MPEEGLGGGLEARGPGGLRGEGFLGLGVEHSCDTGCMGGGGGHWE